MYRDIRKPNFLSQIPAVVTVFFLASLTLPPCPAQTPVTAELLELARIWDRSPHNAFTDLIRFDGKFYCAFREGSGHVSTDGKIRLLCSSDARTWTPAALIALSGYDLRDPHLSITPQGKLMLLAGAAPRRRDNQSTPTASCVCFSDDGTCWTHPRLVTTPGRWLWRITWHKNKAYGFCYGIHAGRPFLDLLVSDDGLHYQPLLSGVLTSARPTEATIRFGPDDIAYALLRRDSWPGQPASAMLGVSSPPYTRWAWYDLGSDFNRFGGPNFIHLADHTWIAAGRTHRPGLRTTLTLLDTRACKMTRVLDLPSAGDTSYPGLLWHKGRLYLSYYSSHEHKTSIYLALVKITPGR